MSPIAESHCEVFRAGWNPEKGGRPWFAHPTLGSRHFLRIEHVAINPSASKRDAVASVVIEAESLMSPTGPIVSMRRRRLRGWVALMYETPCRELPASGVVMSTHLR